MVELFFLEELGVEPNLYIWTVRTLRELGLKPSRRLGQSFTVNPAILRDFAGLCSNLSRDRCVEIGTGLGVVTYILSKCCRRVISIEKDPRLYEFSRKLLSRYSNIEIIHGDALELLHKLEPKTVAGTVPYSITGPLLGAIASSTAEKVAIVLQKDVVDRLLAKHGSRRYGSITVLMQTFFKIHKVNVYPPKYFYPEPEVSSAMVEMTRVREVPNNMEEYEKFLKCLFSYRRKTLRNALARCCRRVDEDIYSFLDSSKRVFHLPPEDILDIFLRCI